MYNTSRKNGGSNAPSSPARIAVKGLFQNGIWHCNCKPRLPAAHFLVRKECPNKGRWFYTCQEQGGANCGFFLWDNDAASREMNAIINNSRSEPAASVEAPACDGDPTDRRTVEGHIEASNKWMVDLVKKEEQDFGERPLSLNGDTSLARAIEKRVISLDHNPRPETPRKVARVNLFSTPGSKRKRDETEVWPSPNTGQIHSDDVFTSPPTSRLKGGIWNKSERSGLISPSTTPTPVRVRGTSQPSRAAESLSDQTDYDITKEVMALLKDQSLDEETYIEMRQVLNRYALKTQGITKGRDITRTALKSKECKIGELEQLIVELQKERDLDKVIIRHFETDMAQSLSKRGQSCGRLNG